MYMFAIITEFSMTASQLVGLTPSILLSDGGQGDVQDAIDLYKDDLPFPELIEQELLRWKTM